MLNVPILRKVQKALREEPKRLRMSLWTDKLDSRFNAYAPSCGTVGCIAGWVYMLTYKKSGAIENADFECCQAIKILGLPKNSNSLSELFYVQNWPEDLFVKFMKTDTGSPEKAEVVCEVIDNFINKYGPKKTVHSA
jgi:hypothetical protein